MGKWDFLIIGAAVTAVVTIIVTKYVNENTTGGAQGNEPMVAGDANFGRPQPLYVIDLPPTPSNSAAVVQVNPNTEAAYNVQPVEFVPAFGPTVNQAGQEGEAVLPY